MAATPSGRPAAPSASPSRPRSSSRPWGRRSTRRSPPPGASPPRPLSPARGSRSFPAPQLHRLGSRARFARPGVGAVPLGPQPAARAHPPSGRLHLRQPRRAPSAAPRPARRDDVVAPHWPPLQGPADWLPRPGGGSDAPPPTAPLAAGRRCLGAGDTRGARRGVLGAEPAGPARAMERLRDVRAQLQAWERAFWRQRGRRPVQVLGARGWEAEGAALG